MKSVKRIDGDYEINSINASDSISINTSLLTVNGNLVVTGNRNEVRSTVTTITDQFITLADGNDNTQNAGIEIVKNAATNTKAGIRYNISSGAWEVSSDLGTWATVIITSGGSNTQVQFNDNGLFGGDADFTYNKTSNSLTLNGSHILTNQVATPSAVASSVVFYAKTIGSGGTGLYFVNGSLTDELVSKSKSIVYGIIF
jgi:hypothetical protein